MYLVCLFVALVVTFGYAHSLSAECSRYTVLNSRDRAQGLHRGNALKCDSGLAKGWYRFMGKAGTAMPTSCTREHHCGTNASGWMQGSHPTQAEGIVNRTVCHSWMNNCCFRHKNIRVGNCGGRFYVYELVPTFGCDLRYCGNGTGLNLCASQPCFNEGTCTGDNIQYNCTCPRVYNGSRCEIIHCPQGWDNFSNFCYKFSSTILSWENAENTCQSFGGHLASITSQAEQNFIFTSLSKYQNDYFWIGYNDRAEESRFNWTDGSNPEAYKNWMSSEPNDSGNEDCVELLISSNGKWNDVHCKKLSGFICKTKSVSQCASNPCLNGGTCTEDNIQYNCTCPRGYNGSLCETSLTQCNSNPCLNGGSCHGDQNHYYCNCYHGFTGRRCETSLRTRVVCEDTYMQIDLKNSYFSDFDWRNFHLNDPSCRAVQNHAADTVRLRAPLDGCGTTYMENQETITFLNEVKNDDRWNQASRNASSISRGWNIALHFFCKYERKRLVSTSFKPSKKTVVAVEGSYGNFTFTMDLYQTSRYRTPYSPLAYPVVVYPNQPLWVQYEVKNTNADLVVFAENCRATTTTNPDSLPRHVFLERGCIRDSTMVYIHNPYSKVQRFSIRSFRFAYSNSHLVYLHCELLVCHQNSTNSRCAVGCPSGRRRRDLNDLESSKPYDLSAGPLKGETGSYNADKGGETPLHTNTILIAVLVTAGVFFVIILILLITILYRNRRRYKHNRTSKPINNIAQGITLNSYEQENVENDEKESHN